MRKQDPRQLFARNLKRLRTRAGYSQEELADRSGLHRTYISSVERAQRNLSLINIFVLAEALGCDPRDLIAPAGPT